MQNYYRKKNANDAERQHTTAAAAVQTYNITTGAVCIDSAERTGYVFCGTLVYELMHCVLNMPQNVCHTSLSCQQWRRNKIMIGRLDRREKIFYHALLRVAEGMGEFANGYLALRNVMGVAYCTFLWFVARINKQAAACTCNEMALVGSVFSTISPLLEKCAATATHRWLAQGWANASDTRVERLLLLFPKKSYCPIYRSSDHSLFFGHAFMALSNSRGVQKSWLDKLFQVSCTLIPTLIFLCPNKDRAYHVSWTMQCTSAFMEYWGRA